MATNKNSEVSVILRHPKTDKRKDMTDQGDTGRLSLILLAESARGAAQTIDKYGGTAWESLVGKPEDRDPRINELEVILDAPKAKVTCSVPDVDAFIAQARAHLALDKDWHDPRTIEVKPKGETAKGETPVAVGQPKVKGAMSALFGDETPAPATPPAEEKPAQPPAADLVEEKQA